MPFLAVYLEKVRHTPLDVIGATYLASGVLTLLSQLAGGRLTDLYGSKPIMLLGYISSVVSAAATGYLILVGARVDLLLTLYPVFSLFRGVSNPASSALVASMPRKNLVQTGFSLQTVGGNLGFGFGPAIGGFLAERFGYATVFGLSSIMAAVATLITLARIPRVKALHQYAGKRSRIRPDGFMLVVLLEIFLIFFVNGYMYTTLSLYSAQFLHTTNQELGYLFATNGFTIVLLQLPLMRLLERMRLLKTAPALGAGLTALAFIVVSQASGFIQLEESMFTSTLGEIFITVPTQMLVTSKSNQTNRGTYQGYYSASTSLGRSVSNFVGPSMIGVFYQDPPGTWLVTSAVAVGVAAAYALTAGRGSGEF